MSSSLPRRLASLAILGLLASFLFANPAAAHDDHDRVLSQTSYQAFNCPAQTPASQPLHASMVTSGWWNFRIAPYGSGQSCTLVRTLSPGTAVTVRAESGNWRFVRIDSTGEGGWIHRLGLRHADSLGAPGNRTGRIVSAVYGGCSIRVDSSIQRHVEALLAAAAADGFSQLCGRGWRDPQQQIRLRIQNCGSSYWEIYQKPSGWCSPPTAIPGTSNHEVGLAIDFYTGGGSSITSAEFTWLFRNAARFGLYNLPSERWHWSTNGR